MVLIRLVNTMAREPKAKPPEKAAKTTRNAAGKLTNPKS